MKFIDNLFYISCSMIFTKPLPKQTKRTESFKDRLIYSVPKFDSRYFSEVFKGEVDSTDKVRFPTELGEAHPFDYDSTEKISKKYGIVGAIVDKYIDFMFAGGINIASEDDRAKQIIEDFMRDNEFESNMRRWIKQAFNKGFSPLELGKGKNGSISGIKLLNSNYVYVNRDSKGNILSFKQCKWNNFDRNKIIEFDPEDIADLNLNTYPDCYYGYGKVYPLICFINDLIGARKEMHTIMYRKANNPLFFIMGNKDKGIDGDFPTAAEMQNLGQELEWLNNKHEWVLSDYVKPMTIDFGNIGDKFEYIVDNDLECLYTAAQIPAVLMGKASVPEGLANVQMKTFELNIQSLREDVEKVIEQKIFRRVLSSQGIDQHVEIIWGLPSEEEKLNKIKHMTELLKNPFLNENLRAQLELQVAELLGLDPENVESNQEERAKEENRKQPIVPGQNAKPPSKNPNSNNEKVKLKESHCKYCNESINEELTIKEWVDFNYQDYLENVLSITNEDEFKELKGITRNDLRAGLLSSKEIDALRTTMIEGFQNNWSMQKIKQVLNKRIEFKDRLRMKDGKIIITQAGRPAIAIPASKRAIAIVRSETVRLANLGAMKSYRDAGIEKVKWITTNSDRTCQECLALNGVVFDIDKAPQPPLHSLCRCTTGVVLE